MLKIKEAMAVITGGGAVCFYGQEVAEPAAIWEKPSFKKSDL
jgi:hypothetical protein